jgi:hypothetical protein
MGCKITWLAGAPREMRARERKANKAKTFRFMLCRGRKKDWILSAL